MLEAHRVPRSNRGGGTYIKIKETIMSELPDNQKRQQTPLPQGPSPLPKNDNIGPETPRISKPDTNNLLERMKRVAPDNARRYHQRSGE